MVVQQAAAFFAAEDTYAVSARKRRAVRQAAIPKSPYFYETQSHAPVVTHKYYSTCCRKCFPYLQSLARFIAAFTFKIGLALGLGGAAQNITNPKTSSETSVPRATSQEHRILYTENILAEEEAWKKYL